MHNLISRNQLDGWNHQWSTDNQKLDDYYECLVECETNQNECKHICRDILR